MDRFEVYLSDEGLAEIDGEPVVAAPGKSVHEAVLDTLQWYAQERGSAVEATVNQGSGLDDFTLQVSPDGSSRLLDSGEGPDPEPEPGPEADLDTDTDADVGADTDTDTDTATDPDPAPEPEPEPAPGPGPDLATSAAASALATAVGRARDAARTPSPRTAAPEPAPTTEPDRPAKFSERIDRVNELASEERLEEALAAATALRENLTLSLGAEDPHVLEARSLEAYVAHLCGEHREALVLALGVARTRCTTGDLRAPGDVARAAAYWQQLDDDRAAVVHGRELLHMWAMLNAHGLLTPRHREIAARVRKRVDSLAAYA
ncbi:hypothetical protein ACIQNG_05115 [Streptomyces sp. NPDC091377]|uniref:hypothetical protein n=1 Tax=Streptomyces sp. NPDC091377 TaxID=3365995 RepID=UPI003830F229